MSLFGEKMRHMRGRLKSVGELMRRTAVAGIRDAAQAVQKARRWPRDWWAGRKADGPDAGEPSLAGAQPSPDGAIREPSMFGLWRDRHPRLAKALRIAGVTLAALLALPYLFILIFRVVDPPFSALMLRHALLGYEITYEWANFDEISPNLATAAIIAEDSRFCQHWGVDWTAVGDVLDDLEAGETPRGASTIPMQTAKNLFLWPEQSYLRKALEVPLAQFMTLILPKRRVLEIYLNIAEWGPGVYGAEAASRYHFGKSAASLSRAEAALLVAALPNPHVRNAGRPGPKMRRLANRVQARVGREAQDAACVFDG
jgi:monofunctional biosynthetic peptidoglycan transglycosylase